MTDRQVGSEGLRVDIVPPLLRQPNVGTEVVQVDVVVPIVRAIVAGLGARVDAIMPHPATRSGAIRLMVDYVASLVPTNAARWSGLAFEMGTASPLAYWSSGAFQTAGSSPVVWVTDHFEVAP